MISMWKKFLKTLRREERGITGLETAIILIAFVVIASVFAYTVLSAGIFSSQKGQEAVYSGLEGARATMKINGSVVAKATDGALTQVIFTVANPLDGAAVDLSSPIDLDTDGIADSDSVNVTVISYHSLTDTQYDLDFSAAIVGWGDSDNLLEPGEKFEIVVDMGGVETIGTYKTFALELSPVIGAVLTIERTTPAYLDDVMILN